MARIGIIKSKTNKKQEQNNDDSWFTYNWVLEQLSKDYDIEGISRIGFTEDGYEVFVVTDDDKLSTIPHFHYRKREKGQKCEFHTCIRFDESKYFYHIGNEDILNDKQKENLIKFLTSNRKYFKTNMSNWEILIINWNHQNDNKKVDMKSPMPNYNNLPNKK